MTRLLLTALATAVFGLLVAANDDQQTTSEDGFAPIFNGQSLEGWQGGTDGYEIKDGAIVSQPKGSGNLYTVKEYSDFALRFEFKLTPGANNGIGIRQPLPEAGKRTDPAYAGM